ncbi:ankyrin repeat-containing protein ITN1-like [Phalaenopsis equestris]|uniref:ankyrin repeat-containing protein ITN1-like n=1 Tax=Phalaenopsis equestris TaxID=78828 RepID=UPI0009E57B4D|nr:ankyrin repeat-containing protein ITN1-like [Phalaenopsis equestris]
MDSPAISPRAAAPALVLSNSGKRIDQAAGKKKYVKQVTGRYNDTELHLAAQRGDVAAVRQVLSAIDALMTGTSSGADFDAEVAELRSAVVNEVNEVGETAMFVAGEKGHLDVVVELMKYADKECVTRKNRSGFDVLHVASREGHHAIVQALLDMDPKLSRTFGPSNSTPLISAATRGHKEVVELLLAQDSNMVELAKTNGKNALHFSARQGHVDVVKALLEKDPQLALRTDKKGQTALHMAAKGTNCDVVKALVDAYPAIVMLPDKYGNTALHVATRKKRAEIVNALLLLPDTHVNALTRDHRTALDIAEDLPLSEEAEVIKECLSQHGAVRANDLNQPRDELRKTVTEIKKDVHTQLEQTRKTNRNVHGIAKEIRKLHREGINNATNSVTVVAVLFATVAFAAIFTVPGGDEDSGVAVAVLTTSFKIFFIFNAIALFTSLAVVVVQITLVRGETKSERRVVGVINKLMWLASVCTTVAFIASSYIIVGHHFQWAAMLVTVIGGVIMAGVLGTMTYYVVKSKKTRKLRKKEKSSRRSAGSSSWHVNSSESEINPIYNSSMESTTEQESCSWSRKKTRKQPTAKRDDGSLHSAARAGNLALVNEILMGLKDEELREELLKLNQAGETALYVAAEYGFQDIVSEMLKYHDIKIAGIKAKNGYDPLHIAAKHGDFDVLKELLKAFPELAMTVDLSNTTPLHTAASQGHLEIVYLLLEVDNSLAKITRSNGKTALHSAARNGHLEVVKLLLDKDSGISCRHDNKGQTALHMAVKGHNLEVVEELLKHQPSLVNVLDMKGNTALHMATRKGRPQIVMTLLNFKETDTRVINRSGETALDTAERAGNSEIVALLKKHGLQSARTIRPTHAAHELKQTVSDIKHGVHSQLQHTHQTSKHVLGIAKRLKKLHREGLNNAINSTTVVAVLIATVAFAAIFTVPGQYADSISPGVSLGEANIAHQMAFMIFFIFDSVALFISLAVVVVQTSLVVIESKAKKKMMAIINKLMWLACVLISVSFLSLSFVVVGRSEIWMAVGVTIMGTGIMAATLGTLTYWVIVNRIEAKKMKSSRRSSLSRSGSRSLSRFSDVDLLYGEKKKIYAI